MDWQAALVYLIVAAAALLLAKRLINALRGKRAAPACCGCSFAGCRKPREK